MDDRAQRFRARDALEGRQEIVSPESMLSEDDLVFFLLATIPDLDLAAFYEYYSTDDRGQPPFSAAGMVKLGNLSTDGTKIEANASRHKAMSYG